MNNNQNLKEESLKKNYSSLLVIGICLIWSTSYFDTQSIRNASPLIVCLGLFILVLVKTIKLKMDLKKLKNK